jgi:hypothetical protein
MPELTPVQQQALDATRGAVQRIAMKIVTLPREQREAQYSAVRGSFEEAIKKFNVEGDPAAQWLDITMATLRALVSEIEAGGGAKGGVA